MKDTPQEGIRKTIYIDEKLFRQAETMYSMAIVLDKYFLNQHQIPKDFRSCLDDQLYDLPNVPHSTDVESLLDSKHKVVRQWSNCGWFRITKTHNFEIVPLQLLINFTYDYAPRNIYNCVLLNFTKTQNRSLQR